MKAVSDRLHLGLAMLVIVTRLWAERSTNRDSISGRGKKFCLERSSPVFRLALWPTQALI